MKEKKEKLVKGNEASPKKRSPLTYTIVGGIGLIAFILILAVVIALMSGKPSKKTAEKVVKSYIEAMNDADGDKFLNTIDPEGYIIFQEEGEKKFDKNYKDKKDYIKEYLEDHDYDDMDEAKESLAATFKSTYKYTSSEYSVKQITSVAKSSRSKNIKVVKAKIKYKNSYSSDTKTMKFYLMKVKGKYKVVGMER